jgi:hypothetical protein
MEMALVLVIGIVLFWNVFRILVLILEMKMALFLVEWNRF